MSRWPFIVGIAVALIGLVLHPLSARADFVKRLPILPSLGPAAVPSFLSLSQDADAPRSPDPIAFGFGIVGKIARLAAKLQSDTVLRQTEGGPRNPTLRDPARERDATSLGVLHATVSRTGAGLAVAGAAGGGAPLLFGVLKSIPIKIGPMAFLGGGGIMLRARW
jgi:hypothetical protein